MIFAIHLHKLDQRDQENYAAIPPHWDDNPPEEEMDVEPLEIIEGFRENTCKHDWCALENSVKWYGPAKFGEVLTTDGVTFPLPIVVDEGKSHLQVDNEL